MVMLLFFSCSKQSHAVFYYSWILWYELQMLVQILYVIVLSENVGIITFKKNRESHFLGISYTFNKTIAMDSLLGFMIFF